MDTLTRARDLRREHPNTPARHLIAWARHEAARPEWLAGLVVDGSADADGFTLALSVSYDEYALGFGTFADEWSPGAIPTPNGQSARHFRYYVPECTADEHREGLRAMGYGRHESWVMAQRWVREDMHRAINADYHAVTVTASREGIELGRGDLCGVVDPYDAGLVYDVASEAIHEARDALGRLCDAAVEVS